MGETGHVAWVEKVYFDSNGNATDVDITEYNYDECSFSSRKIPANNPDGFIHTLAYNEGVTSLHYLDCYEMGNLCSNQTHQEWEWILSRVAGYRCQNCSGDFMAQADTFYDAFAMGGGGGGTTSPSLPNLQNQEFNVHDSVGNLLVESKSFVNIGQTYELHNWPVSRDFDCVNGIESGDDTIKTDTFYKIVLSEDEGSWNFLGRNYTQCANLVKDDFKKEILSFTVPPEAIGKRVYFRSKVDYTGEVKESNEHDNWSDIEWYPVPGSCDLTASYTRLTGGRTSIFEGEQYAFETSIKNTGPNPCPIDTRNAYYEKKPGSSTWTYVTDDSTSAHDLVPNQENYEVMLSDLPIADTPGIHEVMVCADYLSSNQETNESNNCITSTFEVKMYRPDLATSSVGLTHNYTSLVQGDRFGLSMVVKNQGNAPATVDTRSAYYLLPPGYSTWIYQTDDLTTASQMCVGCSKTEWNTTDPYTASIAGWWQGLACADRWNWQTELDEVNNCKSFSFYVAPAGPDLIVSAIGNREGSSVRSGTYIHPWCTVKNVGNKTPTADSRLAYYIDGVYRTDDYVGVSQVNPGQEKWEEVQSSIIKLGNRGNRTYTCCADYQGKVLELNESNNCASMNITVW